METRDGVVNVNSKAVFPIFWKEKLWILIITFGFSIGGGIYSYSLNEEFISEGKLLPEISGNGNNSLGGLANLFGVGGFELGMKNSTDAIRPDLYPDILKSTPFFIYLLKQEVINKNGIKLIFEDFYHIEIENNKKPLEKNIVFFKGKPLGVIVVNKLTEDRIKDLGERIIASIDKKSGVILVSVKMPDPVVSANIARIAIDYLTQYVVEYRTEKIRKEVDFLAEKVKTSKGRFYSNQERKAQYSDQFSAPTIRLQSADIRRERIESEYRISSSFYNELLKKYEEAKIKLQQETPVFKVLNPPSAPVLKSEPKKLKFVVGFFFLGFCISLIFASLKNFDKVISLNFDFEK